jgi:hypothetical protein
MAPESPETEAGGETRTTPEASTTRGARDGERLLFVRRCLAEEARRRLGTGLVAVGALTTESRKNCSAVAMLLLEAAPIVSFVMIVVAMAAADAGAIAVDEVEPIRTRSSIFSAVILLNPKLAN